MTNMMYVTKKVKDNHVMQIVMSCLIINSFFFPDLSS